MAATTYRIFYAVQALGIDQNDAGSITWMKGVQSVGITTNFNLEQLFELGQLGIYQNIENVPEIEVTVEKVVDGRGTLYLTACPSGSSDIVSASNQKAGLYLIIYDSSHTAASGNSTDGGGAPLGVVYCSGMRPSNVSFRFPVEGNFTESVTFVGNDKKWVSETSYSGNYPPIGDTGNYQSPNAVVFRRQHYQPSSSTIPAEVTAAVGSGKIQNLTITADIRRENLFELGAYRPYIKYANFPVTVTSDFEVIALSGDRVQASGDGYNLTNQAVNLYFYNGTSSLRVNCGAQNKLTSVNYTGGDTGGGNATITYSYQGFNYFQVTTG